jgi:hypothetical protein
MHVCVSSIKYICGYVWLDDFKLLCAFLYVLYVVCMLCHICVFWFIAYQNKNHTFNWLNTLHVTFAIPRYRLECWYRPVQKPCIDWYYWIRGIYEILHTLNLGCSFITIREPCNNQRLRCDIEWLHVANHLYHVHVMLMCYFKRTDNVESNLLGNTETIC